MANSFDNLKLGKRPPKKAPAIRFRDIYRPKVALPAHPPVDYLESFTGWKMLGNDNFGVCEAVTGANVVRLKSKTIGKGEYYPTQEEVWALYRTQNPNFIPDPDNPVEDNGMSVQTMLEWWTKNTWGGTKLLSFAQVDHTNLDEMRAAVSIIGTVNYGFQVQPHNFEEFKQGVPWTYDPNGRIVGGHGVCGGAHLDTVAKDQGFITWAQQTAFAQSAEKNLFDEFWVLIFPEHLGNKQFMANIDVATLAQAYSDLTHRPFPAPIPPNPNPGCNLTKPQTWKPFAEATLRKWSGQ